MYKIDVVRSVIEHIDDIMVVENLCFMIPWSRNSMVDEISNNKFALYYSAKIGEKIVGYAGMWTVCDEGHITNIAVHPEFRRNGVGSALLEALINAARQNDISRMTLEVRKSNSSAQALYKRYGFQTCGLRKAYYADNGEDAIIMWKSDI